VQFLLRYQLTRKDLWRGYWISWAKERGIRYATLFTLAVGLAAIFNWHSFRISIPWLVVGAAGAVCLGVCLVTALTLAASQIAYKSDGRILRVDSSGWSTFIGRKTGSRTWREIASVVGSPDFVFLTNRNGNFLAIPARAFRDAEEQQSFVAQCKQWLAAGNA
jgi:hypothetical protein